MTLKEVRHSRLKCSYDFCVNFIGKGKVVPVPN
jgi:hypothetical protein